MAVSSGDILIGLVKGTFLGQNWLNRFFYRCNDNDATGLVAQDLAGWLFNNAYGLMAPTLNDQWTMREADVYLYKDPVSEFGQVTGIIDGESIDQPAPSALCATFSNSPGIPALRYSYKRIAGLSESHINGNSLLSQAAFDAFATFLSGTLTAGGITVTPVQCRTTGIPPIGGGVNPTVNRALSGVWTYKLGTQNTRKPGYGD